MLLVDLRVCGVAAQSPPMLLPITPRPCSVVSFVISLAPQCKPCSPTGVLFPSPPGKEV